MMKKDGAFDEARACLDLYLLNTGLMFRTSSASPSVSGYVLSSEEWEAKWAKSVARLAVTWARRCGLIDHLEESEILPWVADPKFVKRMFSR